MVKAVETVKNDLPKVPQRYIRLGKEILNVSSRLLQSHIRQEHLTGGTSDTSLAVRSGKLRASLKIIPATEKGDQIEAGVAVGPSVYARVHIGPSGQRTVITGTKGKGYLTIPLPAARAGKGSQGPARGSAIYGPWTNTFVRKTSRGNLVMFGQMASYSKVKVGGVAVKGVDVRKVRPGVVPLFLLKKSVTVKSRVFPEEQLAWIKPIVLDGFKRAKIE